MSAAPTPIWFCSIRPAASFRSRRSRARRKIPPWACSQGSPGSSPRASRRSRSAFSHGTTITTNALLEMRGAKVGLLITKGYRAVQEVQNQARDGNLFDYFYQKPAAIAPQRLTKEIPERCDYAGRVLRPLDKDAVRRAARELK